MRPLGGYMTEGEDLPFLPERERVELAVTNTGDRPVQVGSHYHFFEANPALRFDRRAAFGCRLCIPAGTAVRFEPGTTTPVTLVPFGGRRRAVGFHGLVDGSTREGPDGEVLQRLARRGFADGRGGTE